MNWLFRILFKILLKDFEQAYKVRYAQTHDDSMRPDLYWLQKYLNGDF